MAKTKTKPGSEECIHYWIIETPQGPTSQGKCQKCGSSKDFLNYYEPEGPQPMTIYPTMHHLKHYPKSNESLGDICVTNGIDNGRQI